MIKEKDKKRLICKMDSRLNVRILKTLCKLISNLQRQILPSKKDLFSD